MATYGRISVETPNPGAAHKGSTTTTTKQHRIQLGAYDPKAADAAPPASKVRSAETPGVLLSTEGGLVIAVGGDHTETYSNSMSRSIAGRYDSTVHGADTIAACAIKFTADRSDTDAPGSSDIAFNADGTNSFSAPEVEIKTTEIWYQVIGFTSFRAAWDAGPATKREFHPWAKMSVYCAFRTAIRITSWELTVMRLEPRNRDWRLVNVYTSLALVKGRCGSTKLEDCSVKTAIKTAGFFVSSTGADNEAIANYNAACALKKAEAKEVAAFTALAYWVSQFDEIGAVDAHGP